MIGGIVKKYQAVFVLAVLIFILGLTSYQQIPREEFPEIRRPMIFVTTIYPGVSAKDIENLITQEIEAKIDGLAGLDELTSTSRQGMSTIIAEFTGDTEVEVALRRVRERVDSAKPELPADAEDPIVKELNFSDQPILILSATNPNGLEVLESTADLLEEEFKKIDGILEVNVSGKLAKEVGVDIDPLQMKHYGFSFSDIKNAIQAENTTIPGGVLKSPTQEYSIAVSGEIKDPHNFSNIVVKNEGKFARLKDMAKVRFTYAEPETISRVNGEPAITLSLTKRGGENILRIINDAKMIVEKHQHKFPYLTNIVFTHDSSENVNRMVADLENNIYTGLVFVILVTFFFLGSVNAAFVSLGIPFSMLLSFFILNILGVTLNMVVLFSLILALGMLVDNGIVIVENIYRHRSLGKSRVQAAIDGCAEVAVPISTSTLTTILAFFPIIFMPGIMGEFLKFIPQTVIIVLTSSLAVALSITTVFCSRFLRFSEKDAKKMNEGSGLFKKIQVLYQQTMDFSLRFPKTIVALTTVFVIAGIAMNGKFGKEPIFFPSPDPSAAIVSIESPSGTPLHESDALTERVEKLVNATEGSMETIQGTVGQGGDRGSGLDASRGKVRIGFAPFLEREFTARHTLDILREELSKKAGALFKVQAQEGGPPSGHDIDYEIIGDDYTTLGSIAEKILNIVEKHRSVLEDIDTDFEAIKPEISVNVDREKAARLDLDTRMIADTIRTAMNGSKVSVYREGKDEYDVIVRLAKPYRSNLEVLRDLEIVKKEKRVPLSTIAEVGYKTTVATIKRRGQRRAVSVWADFKPDIQNKETIKKEVANELAKINLPRGYQVGFGKGQDERSESTQFLLNAFITAIMLIFMVLVLQFNSVSQPIIILISVFLSLGGVFWGLLISQKTFVIIISGIGVISLAGVVVNNAIVLIDFINQLRNQGKSIENAIIEAGITRLRPVLLTALTTVISLLPMGFGVSFDFYNFSIQVGSESAEMWAPMAWAIIFGLTLATLLTLVIVPLLVLIDHQIKSKISRIFN